VSFEDFETGILKAWNKLHPDTPIRRDGSLAARVDSRRPPVDKGVAVSIGPVSEGSQWVQEWMTFPVTPESLPVSVSGIWNDTQIIGLGEASVFAGSAQDTISFSGILEPPEYYIGGLSTMQVEPTLGPNERGAMNVAYERERLRQSGFSEAEIASGLPGVPALSDGSQGVVMQSGARAGPNVYYEPHAFKKCIEGAVKHGEIVKLVVGDDYGWTGQASIRDFTWRYEDPDPDTLYFDITFRQHRVRKLRAAQQKRKSPKHPHVTTKSGDTLKKIAVREWGEASKWTMIRDLNKHELAQLWYYGKKDNESPPSVGHKIKGKHGFKVGLKGSASHPKDVKDHFDLTDFSGDTKFRGGVRLVVQKSKDVASIVGHSSGGLA
jgi:LysM repeat protein